MERNPTVNPMPLRDLPLHWQEHIRHLREDRAALRCTIAEMEKRPVPRRTFEKMRALRVENAKMRRERNDARAEVDQLRAELEARSA